MPPKVSFAAPPEQQQPASQPHNGGVDQQQQIQQQQQQQGDPDPPEVAQVVAAYQTLAGGKGADTSIPMVALEEACPRLSKKEIGLALNWLAARHRLEFLSEPGAGAGGEAEIHVRLVDSDPSKLARLHDLDVKHRLLFQLIERSGDRGMWARDLRFRSNLQHTEITKILKTLESRKLIKSVTSVAAKNRKVYLLFDVIPSVEVTGDVWYSGSNLDRDFIEILSTTVLKVLQTAGSPPRSPHFAGGLAVEDVFDQVVQTQVSKQALSLQNILGILEVLVYQGRIERIFPIDDHDPRVSSGEAVFRVTNTAILNTNGLTDGPCGTCPVSRECAVGALVSPETCPYIAQYADF
jgi:DNA-directed RNA polymerase III subunit RPC6